MSKLVRFAIGDDKATFVVLEASLVVETGEVEAVLVRAGSDKAPWTKTFSSLDAFKGAMRLASTHASSARKSLKLGDEKPAESPATTDEDEELL